jgi:mRNA degradation ribonuclease J1/J2
MSEKVAITLLGGVNEVGGNIVLLEDFEFDVKLFVDFGVNIKRLKQKYRKGVYPQSIEE